MSLIICPECGHELSTSAIACPNCGYTFVVKKQVVTRSVIEPESNLPKWILIPAVTIVAILMIVIFVLIRNNSDEANARNVNVDLTKTKTTPVIRETVVREVESNPPTQITVPSNPTTVNPPSSMPSSSVPSSQQTVPSSPAETVKEPDKGMVKIEAKVSTNNGSIKTVKNEKIYLLDEDVETILSKANLDPIESNTLLNSFGLAVMYPDRYSEFNRKALEAIKKHIKYSGLTDAAGKVALKDVKPESYYLFGITKSKSGFAMWNSPVNINTGENILNLSPASFNEIDSNAE